MSLYDYRAAMRLRQSDVPFYALVMAAMARADTPNTEKLKAAWPDVYDELRERWHAPGGLLGGESDGGQ